MLKRTGSYNEMKSAFQFGGNFLNVILERRLEFLRLEAKASPSANREGTKRKYQTSERNIYYDAETRDTWQPVLTQLFNLDKARLIVLTVMIFFIDKQVFTFKLQAKPKNQFICQNG